MQTTTSLSMYKRFRFSQDIISHVVWLYFRFSLSYRAVEELLAEPGIVVTYETIRHWSRKFGQAYAISSGVDDLAQATSGFWMKCF